MEYVKKPKSSYSSIWVNGSYITNFDSTVSSGSNQRLALENIRDAMEIYTGITEGVPGTIMEEIMQALCRDYKVGIKP